MLVRSLPCRRSSWIVTVVISIFACVGLAPAASVDYFLKLDGIDGDVTETGHAGEIQIESFTLPVARGAATGGAGAGKVQMQDIHFVAKMSKASPGLMLACAQGMLVPAVKLTVVNTQTRQPYMQITLRDCLVSSYQSNGDGSDLRGDTVPTDQFSLNFTRIDFNIGHPTLTGVPAVQFGWDVKRAKKI